MLPLPEAPSQKCFPMLKLTKISSAVEGFPPTTAGEMIVLGAQLELALSVAEDSHPVSAFQIFGKN